MKIFGISTVSEFLGDKVVYRNLKPLDRRLPTLSEMRTALGLLPGKVPRKSEADYGRVIAHLLQQARFLDTPEIIIERLLFIGDTQLLDVTAFTNICQAGNWPGLAFIGSETDDPASFNILPQSGDLSIYLANRWTALSDFDHYCASVGFSIDERTAVVVDLDKTALGARGRNAHVIDQVRVQAVQDTVSDLLGEVFDVQAFKKAYDQLNQAEFHPFTGDNQDYLAYICLIFGSGLMDMDSVVSGVRSGEFTSFEQFIKQVDAHRIDLPSGLESIHDEIFAYVLAGDPTPFKAFRHNEYLSTIRRMGCMSEENPVGELLANEIVITQEVRSMAMTWKEKGALLFALSDKPDEASVPTPAQISQGYKPIHCTKTHAVGA